MSIQTPAGAGPGPHLFGVDLYHADDPVDFHAFVAAGISFVFLKASQGLSMADVRYPSYYARAKSVGLKVGAYHFLDPNTDGATQADHFLSVAKPAKGDIIPVCDSETDGQHVTATTLAFCQRVKAKIGHLPILYTGDSFFGEHFAADQLLGKLTRWIARYGPHPPVHPCAIWQYTDRLQIPGESRGLDTDVFYGDASAFAKLLI